MGGFEWWVDGFVLNRKVFWWWEASFIVIGGCLVEVLEVTGWWLGGLAGSWSGASRPVVADGVVQ